VRDVSTPNETSNACRYGRLAIGYWKSACRVGIARFRRSDNNVRWWADPAGFVCLREFALDEEDVIGDFDVLGGQRALPVERRIAAVGLLADIAQHPVLDAACDGVLDRVGVEQARELW
jgi:hypothetical protein